MAILLGFRKMLVIVRVQVDATRDITATCRKGNKLQAFQSTEPITERMCAGTGTGSTQRNEQSEEKVSAVRATVLCYLEHCLVGCQAVHLRVENNEGSLYVPARVGEVWQDGR